MALQYPCHVNAVPLAYVEIFVHDDFLLASALCKFELMELTSSATIDPAIEWIPSHPNCRWGDLVFTENKWDGFTSQNPTRLDKICCQCKGYPAFVPHWRSSGHDANAPFIEQQPGLVQFPVRVVESTLVRVVVAAESPSIHTQLMGVLPEPSLTHELEHSFEKVPCLELRRRLERAITTISVGTTADALSCHRRAERRTQALKENISSYLGKDQSSSSLPRSNTPLLVEPAIVHMSISRIALQASSPTDRFYIISAPCQENIHVLVHAAIVASAVRNESVTILLDKEHANIDPFMFPKDALYYNHGSGGMVLTAKVCLVIRSDVDSAAFRVQSKPKRLLPPKTQSFVGGNIKAKAILRDAFAYHPTLIIWGWCPTTGILLYGAPGVGKTLLVRAILQDVPTVLHLKSTDVAHASVGAGEKAVASAFAKARAAPPAVIFIDEFQALFTQRSSGSSSRVTTTLLQCMDELVRWRQAGEQLNSESKMVVVVAATNTPWLIDQAFLRPGRFDRTVHVDLPSEEERKGILEIHMRRMKIDFVGRIEDVAARFAVETTHFSGADLAGLCRAAAVSCLVDGKGYVGEEDFSNVLTREDVGPSNSKALLRQIRSWHLR